MNKYLVLIVSLIVLLFEVLFVQGGISNPIAYLPVIFGVLSLVRIDDSIVQGPGMKVARFVMYLRYLLMPPMLLLSGYFSSMEYDSPEMRNTFLIMVIEMITIYMTISLAKNRHAENVEIDVRNYSFVFPVILLLIAIGLSIKDPIPLSRYHFILSGATELFDMDLENSTQGLPRFLGMVHYILIASLISFFYRVYKKKESKYVYWIGLLATLLLCSFYQDTSRNSMLVPLLSVMLLYNKLYRQYRKQTNVVIIAVVVVSMSMLTLIKQFNTTSYSAVQITKEDTSIIFERYFGGVVGVYDGFKHESKIAERVNSQTLLTEVFSKVIGLNQIMDQENRTSNFYNDALGSRSLIIPTITEGYFIFSWLFCWLYTFAIFKLIIFFDGLFARTKRIDLAFVFVSLSVTLGWMHTGNFIICMNSFHMSMTMLVIFYINVFVGRIKMR